jgi:Spy/CpxP family protein refolding chaperone
MGFALVLGSMAAGTSLAWADDAASGKKPAAEGKKVAAAMPDFYGKLELDDDQKAKIREKMAAAQLKIAPLREQIRNIEQARDVEVKSLLTAAQKNKLESLQATAKAERMAKRKDAKAKSKGSPETGKGAGN